VKSLELNEDCKTYLDSSQLTEQEAVDLQSSGHFDVEFPSPVNGRRYVVRTPRTVGLIPISRDFFVRILPKVPIANLFGMLELVYRLPSLKFFPGAASVSSVDDVYGRLAEMLARAVLERSRKGLYSEYVSCEEECVVVRGRVDVQASIALQMRGRHGLYCNYSFPTTDIIDNRLPLSAIDRIPRLQLVGGAPLDSVRLARRALQTAVSLGEYRGRDCAGRRYNRLNSDYRTIHALARFFLDTMGPGLMAGEQEFLPFCLDMAMLFQDFVAESLKHRLADRYLVSRQHRLQTGGDIGLTFVMDVVISDPFGHAIAVLDTKYKPESRPSPDDVYQVVAYATHLGITRAVLVYPTPVVPISTRIGGVDVTALGFGIGGSLPSAIDRFLGDLVSIGVQ
jgi:5-methylcytosine-specific restriction enzyme subunit McrC